MSARGRAAAWGLLWAGLGWVGAVQAEVYRCPQADGRITYQQQRCNEGRALDLHIHRPDAAALANAARQAQSEQRLADALQRERQGAERRAAAVGPAGIRHAAADAARGLPADAARDARTGREQPRRGARAQASRAPRTVLLRRARATLAD